MPRKQSDSSLVAEIAAGVKKLDVRAAGTLPMLDDFCARLKRQLKPRTPAPVKKGRRNSPKKRRKSMQSAAKKPPRKPTKPKGRK